MGNLSAEEFNRELDLEFLFDRDTLAYKLSHGTSGMQINVRVCPACGDSRWRTYLNLDSGLGNCFVCDKKFTKLSFLHAHLGNDDHQWGATFRYAEELLREQGWRPKRMQTAPVEPGEVKLPFSQPLPIDGQNLLYLEQRGIDVDIAAYFHLRYCEFGWWEFKADDQEAPGKQFFNKRLIIPVFDLDGSLVTFQGRDITGLDVQRKYLFPIQLPGTGRFLLNGQNVTLTSEVAMGEGAFDVMAMKVAFDEDVNMRSIIPVGSFGKHLSYGAPDGNDQLGRFIQLKRRGLKVVTIMWDGEEKALIAALNAAKLLAGVGLTARLALLPLDKDPNEVMPEVVRAAYHEAHLWTPTLDLQWRLRNPYSARERPKYRLA